jgi:hypothetical protein
MSFTIKPINAFLTKDKDTFTKMVNLSFINQDPYVYLTIGTRKYKSKPHTSGGKTPFWIDTFQVPVIMSQQ